MVSWYCLAGATRDSPPMAAGSLIYSHAKVLFFLQPIKLCRDNFARAPLRRFRILGGEQEVFTIRSGWSRDAFGMAKPSKGVLLCFSEGGKNNKNGFLDKKSCGKFGRFVFSS